LLIARPHRTVGLSPPVWVKFLKKVALESLKLLDFYIKARKSCLLDLPGLWSQSCHEAECPFVENPKLVSNMDKNTIFWHYLLSFGRTQSSRESRQGAERPKTDSRQLEVCAQG